MIMTVRETFRFLDKLSLLPVKMTGTKILSVAEECICPMNFQKLHIPPQRHGFFSFLWKIQGHKEYQWKYGDGYELIEFLFRVLASHQHSIFSFPQVRLYSVNSILMSQHPYCILWLLIAFVGRSWEKKSYSDSWIHHVHYKRSLLKIFLRKEYGL